jgi:sugar/nucleoside kinase (ribokinase family)
MQVFDIVTVGHFAIDSIFLPSRRLPFVVLGGSAAYVSLAARCLEARVAAISKVGDDFPDAYLRRLERERVDLSGVVKVENAQTTRFELKYGDDLSNRTLRLKTRAPSLTVDNLPKSLRARAIHIAPIAGEITYDVAEKLRSYTEQLSLDPQGLVRNFNEDGNVSYGSLIDKRILNSVDVYKSSFDEIKATTGLSNLDLALRRVHDYGVKTVIVTLGTEGAVVSLEGSVKKAPAYKSEKIVDPTGAGDVFMGCLLAEYIRGKDPFWCACVGSAAASLVVETVGPTFSGGKSEIYRRARLLYEKEIR